MLTSKQSLDQSPIRNGFTLMELLVVLAIMAIAVAVLTVSVSGWGGSIDQRKVAVNLKKDIENARRTAVRTGQAVNLKLAGKDLSLMPVFGAATDELIFYPDGSSNGGAVSVNGKRLFSVIWLNSKIDDAS